MSSLSDHRRKQYGGLNNGKLYGKSDVFEPSANQTEYIEAKQRAALVEWINGILPGLELPAKASPEELRACLIDGTVLLQILNKLRPGSVNEGGGSHLENVGKFLAVMDQLEIPRFELSDLQRGSMKTVLDCLLAVRARFMNFGDSSSTSSTITRGGNSDAASHGFISPTAEIRRPSVALTHNLGPKFHEVFQLKQGRYAELSAAKISEMMKSNSLDNAPTQSLLSVVNGILDEGIERKNGEIPHRVACLLRKVVLEIERRISTQADHLRTQNNLFKAREEKYQSRIRVLEALAGTGEETGIFADQLQQVKNERSKLEDRKSGEVVITLMKEKEQRDIELSALRQELEIAKRINGDVMRLSKEKEQRDLELSALRQELAIVKRRDEDVIKLIAEKEQRDLELSALRQELAMVKRRDEDVIKLIAEKEQRVLEVSALRQELEIAKRRDEDVIKLIAEKEQRVLEVSALRQELEIARRRDEDVITLTKEKEERDLQLSALRQELEKAKRRDEDALTSMKKEEQRDVELSSLRQELEVAKRRDEDLFKLIKEKEQRDLELSLLRQELEVAKRRDKDVFELMKEKEQRDLEQSLLRQELEVAKRREEDASNLMREKEQRDLELSSLRQELEMAKRELSSLRRELEMAKRRDEDVLRLMKEKEQRDLELSSLRQELEMAKRRDEDFLRLIKEKEQRDLDLSSLRQELEMAKRRDVDALRLMKEKEQRDLELSSLRQELEVAKRRDEDALRLMKDKEQRDLELSSLRQELEMAKRRDEDALRLMKEEEQRDLEISSLRQELGVAKRRVEDVLRLIKEKEQRDLELSALRQELETEKQTHELHCLQMESEANGVRVKLEQMLQKLEFDLEDSRIKVKVLEANTESKRKTWNKKVHILDNFLDFNVNVMKEFSSSSKSIKHEILKAEKSHSQDLNSLGVKLKLLIHATENYHLVLAENRKMYNELQDLKGNIRVYCRVRPFLPGQAGKKTIVEHIGDNGELVVTNPSKQGKDGRRMFRFNKVYNQDSTQAEVFADTQPLIRSVLDGYNVCIFAYGQTGSGKTYTMTGPNGAPPEEWGVNYRALNDLFCISQNRSGSFVYEVGVQMVEIYNEQVRDLLSSASSQKRLGIVSASQSNGLAVPDATMLPVTSTKDVIDLMDVGLKNRAVGATSMNERSSRSHSVVSIHVEGKDLHDGASLHGNLHLVDLAGSERVDRSEVTGDRLKEAQHINKSLSALGDVIFALARKSTHVPYRNSKLTQLLQTSLGGQAKTLMFVQLNPDTDSYSESLSTLKFAERVSGVELGAARSSKEGRDVRELMEQVASLKDTIAKRDDEIEQLQLLKDLKNVNLGATSEKLGTGSLRSGYSASYESPDSTPRHSLKPSGGRGSSISERVNSDYDNNLEYSGRHSEAGSRGELEHDNNPGDSEILEYGDGDSEDRLSDTSDGGDLSVGTESNATGELGSKLSDKLRKHGKVASKIRSLQRATGQTTSTTVSVSRDSIRASTSVKKTNAPGNSTMVKPARKWN